MKTSIYLISGLGADRRAFKKLVFPGDFSLKYLDWIAPNKNESLPSYAQRLSESIDTSKPFYLIGLSFGGMLATEIAKILAPEHTFLISSTPIYTGLPWYYRMAGHAHLQKMVPIGLIRSTNSFGIRFLGAKSKEEFTLLKQLIVDSDPRFMKWALSCILNWRNTEKPQNVTHIHGTGDNTLPIKYTNPDVIINGGTHFMIYSKADQISQLITDKILL